MFGAGAIGRNALDFIGKDKVLSFVDNNPMIVGKTIDGIEIRTLSDLKDRINDGLIVICASNENSVEIGKQLRNENYKYSLFDDVKREIIKERIKSRPNYIEIYKNTIDWIKKNTINGRGIICNTSLNIAYPEVSGYYIPSLIHWGYYDLAIQYAKWLCDIQNKDGSWSDV